MVLVTRGGCHLCEEAQAIVSRVATELAVAYREVDVDADPAVTAEYGDRVPVVLVDGTEHTYWQVDEGRLRRAVAGRRGWLCRDDRLNRRPQRPDNSREQRGQAWSDQPRITRTDTPDVPSGPVRPS